MELSNGFLKSNVRYATLLCFLAGFIFFFLPAAISSARDVSFIWSQNPENVDGYRIYYKTGSSGVPYDGTGVVEGPSPVATGNVTTFTLHSLSDSETYYFALTAFIGALESSYSTEIVLPANTPPADGRTISFVWLPNPENVDGYRLYYKDFPVGSSCPLPADVPYNGLGATEGPSPLDAGNVTTYSLQGLSFDKTYCFALTAYLGAVESDYTPPLTLTGDNPPVATAALVSTFENIPVSGQLPASDPDGDPLVYSIVTNGSLGTASITNTSNGSFTYTPNTNATGSDSFTFKVNDGKIDSNTATVSVTIGAVNAAPTATGGFFVTDENTPASGLLLASDPDGDALAYSIVTNGSLGTATITNAATGAFTYTPNANASGSDSFTFKVNDGTVDSNAATVTVAIAAVNDPPVAAGSALSTNEDTAASGQLSASDPDGDVLAYSIVTNGSLGTATITNAATGAFTYTPNANASGSDSFTFKVNDGTVDSNTATVTITVSAVNEPPAPIEYSISTEVNTIYAGQLLASDREGDSLAYSIVTNGSLGTATITNATAGTFTYTPNANATGSDSFTFKVNDGTVDSGAAVVTVVIFDATINTKVFGDTPGADYPGTLEDTYTNLNTDNNAVSETISTWSWSTSAPHKIANTIIVKADLATIPTYATIYEARLFLYQTSVTGEAKYANSIHKITGKNPIVSQVTGYNAFNGEVWSPVPANTTHNNIPLGLDDIDVQEDSILLLTQEGYRSWLITSMVQEWIASPSTNYGLLIKGEEATIATGRVFAASENQTAGIRPKLVIRYTITPPAPRLILIEEIK